MTLHIGSARTQARVRPLGSSPIARLTLRDVLPLHVGDRVLPRDPGSAGVAILGATVLDVAPPRSQSAVRPPRPGPSGRLAGPPSAAACTPARLLRRRTVRHGRPDGPPPSARNWLADPDRWSGLRRQLAEAVAAHAKRDPLAIGMPPEAARAALGLPDRRWSRRWPRVLGSSSRMATCE